MMNRKERERLEVFSRVNQMALKLIDASRMLRLSYRQTTRIYGRYKTDGDKGLIHKSRGKPSNRAKDKVVRQQIVELCRTKYAGFMPTHASEKLLSNEGIQVDHETLKLS